MSVFVFCDVYMAVFVIIQASWFFCAVHDGATCWKPLLMCRQGEQWICLCCLAIFLVKLSLFPSRPLIVPTLYKRSLNSLFPCSCTYYTLSAPSVWLFVLCLYVGAPTTFPHKITHYCIIISASLYFLRVKEIWALWFHYEGKKAWSCNSTS